MTDTAALAHDVRLHVFRETAVTGEVPQPPAIARALDRPEAEIRQALQTLADGKVLILAPMGGNIWAANPFSAVPSPFRVRADGRRYRAICIWDALGVAAALQADANIDATCGDCGDAMSITIRDGQVASGDGIVHFAVPAHHWWDNIGFT